MRSSKTNRAIKKYSLKTCIDAYNLSEQGDGAQTIGYHFNLTTNQADAAINAGRELITS